MIDYELFSRIRNLHGREGLTVPQIARELDLDPRTVQKWLSEPRFRQKSPHARPSKLDPFKDSIVRLLETHPYTAMQIFQRLREEGFGGAYTIVKEYVRKMRPRGSRAFLKLAFAPGECAQVDWGFHGSIPCGQTSRRLGFFVMVLCHSRMMYLEFTVSQTLEHFLACHQNAFNAFGGVPARIMVDNLKSAVLKHALGQAPVLNPAYLDFAAHHGFAVTPCAVRKANEKGRVESAVGYVKKNFLSGLDPSSLDGINALAAHWVDTVANVRIHGETRKRPVDLFPEEKARLLPLPAYPHDIGVLSSVRASTQFRITLDTNRYSVPSRFAGATLTLKTYPDRLCIYHDGVLIARHPRSYDRYRDFEDPDHVRELIRQRGKARDQVLFARFLALSPRAPEYFHELEKRRMNPRHHARKIVALSEIHGMEPVRRAIEDAFFFQAFSSEYIANILEQRSRSLPEPGALLLTRREDLLDITLAPPDLSLYRDPRG